MGLLAEARTFRLRTWPIKIILLVNYDVCLQIFTILSYWPVIYALRRKNCSSFPFETFWRWPSFDRPWWVLIRPLWYAYIWFSLIKRVQVDFSRCIIIKTLLRLSVRLLRACVRSVEDWLWRKLLIDFFKFAMLALKPDLAAGQLNGSL